MISLLRHARLQRGLQLHRDPATVRKVAERRFRLSLHALGRGPQAGF